jgi:hypothetical protein
MSPRPALMKNPPELEGMQNCSLNYASFGMNWKLIFYNQIVE